MNKYRNQKVTIDGITFDSLKEGGRYRVLKLLVKAKEIKDLELQKKFELQPAYTNANGKHIRAINYLADFYYYDNKLGCYVVEDVKASEFFKTDVYKLKKKLFEYKYKVVIKEIY